MKTIQGMKKIVRLLLQLFLVFTFLPTFVSGLYFSQSDLTLRIPEWTENKNLLIFVPRVVDNTSKIPNDLTYKIVSTIDESLTLVFDEKTGKIIINSVPKNATRILIQASEGKNEATMEINIESIPLKNSRINCDNFINDLCFWRTSKYRIYENQEKNLLGNFGSEAYKKICPNFKVTHYELLNATEFFFVFNNELYANEMLDRDSQYPGPTVDLGVRCVVYDEITGQQFVHEHNINIDILDVDDNPPVAQTNTTVTIHLKDFTAGERLDDNELIVKDVDSTSSNVYSVKILDDFDNALNITFSTMEVEHASITDPPSTLIFARIYSKTTLLPKSPYKVILQATDETLSPGNGEKSINITLLFVGPQHHPTTTTTSLPTKGTISFENNISVPKTAPKLYRVTQPDSIPHSDLIFNIKNSKIFGITRKTGIIYVANTSGLQLAPDKIPLMIQWAPMSKKNSSTSITINIVSADKLIGTNVTCTSDQHTCADVVTKKACESRCGVGSGTYSKNLYAPNCAWRSAHQTSKGPTSRYETCSPNLRYCPDSICDELEQLDGRLCPQDCTTNEPSFGHLKKDRIGLKDGFKICRCDDEAYCSCGPLSLHAADSNEVTGVNSSKANKTRSKDSRYPSKANKKDHDKENELETIVTGAHIISASPSGECGTTCIIGIVCTSFIVVSIIGSFVAWKYRNNSKTRQERKHQTDDINNTLGILPLDYLQRAEVGDPGIDDTHLIGFQAFISANRSLLLPKSLPPDPKWEFPRSRLTLEQVLGEGEFGRVLKAKAIDIGDWLGPTTVAVKTLKEDASGSELADLLSEYQLLKETQHPNVIRLLGACTSPGGPVYLIIEFAEFGSLRNYLRRTRHLESEGQIACSTLLLSGSSGAEGEETLPDKFSNYKISPHDVLSFAWQISKGMSYLTDIKLVHRDLAARNVLLAKFGNDKVCKISDFGLTRDVYEDDAYLKRSKGRVPVKWMAPESLADHIYTSKSDVWSFGVLLWELITLGASPYPGVDVHNLYNLLKAGYRMERPPNCSQQLYKLMISCWHDEPGMRPSFRELICQWEHMLEDNVEYLDLNPRTVHNREYFSSLHALDSPTSSSNESGSGVEIIQTKSVNYLDKSPLKNIKNCDKVEKLRGLWKELPSSSFSSSSSTASSSSSSSSSSTCPIESKPKTIYINEQLENLNCNHYESPIRVRKISIISNSENDLTISIDEPERPQSYIDMEGNKKLNGQVDLLLFNGNDNNISKNNLDSNIVGLLDNN